MFKSIFILLAAVPVIGSATTFSSPNGLTEECRILPQIPGGKYEKDDAKDEQEVCAADFYDTTKVALCPKTWSTSPGTMIYDISESGLSQRDYEAQEKCGVKKGHKKLTKFKQTMNQSGTSGTFSPSPLVYYHLSRYFDATVKVPTAVYRSMDKDVHFERVAKKAHENKMGKSAMNRKGWEYLYLADQNPERYKPTSDLFTDNNRQIYGVLSDGGGERYGEEINGVRSAWGDKQNEEFQETPAFFALRSEKPLVEAIAEGIEKGTKNSTIRKALGGTPSNFQMGVWMKELTDIVLLDYILGQQDRVGNIDFKWYYYWLDAAGKVKSEKLDEEPMRPDVAELVYPKEVEGSPTFLVQRTRINDNDAGVRGYTNFAKRTKMLENLRHFDQETFDKLIALNADLQAQGPIYQYLRDNFGINEKQLKSIVTNTAEATAILQATQADGKLLFDLKGAKDTFKDLAK